VWVSLRDPRFEMAVREWVGVDEFLSLGDVGVFIGKFVVFAAAVTLCSTNSNDDAFPCHACKAIISQVLPGSTLPRWYQAPRVLLGNT
jgi:hypothetical protein